MTLSQEQLQSKGLSLKEQDEIIQMYQDPETGLTSAQDIYKKLRQRQQKIKLKDIKEVLKNIETQQVFSKKKQQFIPIASPTQTYQIDLQFRKELKEYNNKFIGFLNIININTKKVFVLPIKNKTSEHITQLFKDFLQQNNDLDIYSISADKGKEFVNKNFKQLLEDNNIKFLIFDHALSPNATMIIERFNRTLRNKIDKYMLTYKTKNYIDVLQKLVKNYNNTVNSSTGEVPNDLDQNDFLDIDAHIDKYNKLQAIDQQYNNNDKVRLLKEKDIFKKGQKNYTKAIYNINEKDNLGYIVQKQNGKTNQKRVLSSKVLKPQRALPFQLLKVDEQQLIKKEKQKNQHEEPKKQDIQKQAQAKRRLKKEGLENEDFKPAKIKKL